MPEKPGVYIMKNSDGRVIYVGKAKNLKNRVTTYFRKGDHTPKTLCLVSEIVDFDVIITATELDALLTECSLIKHHDPFYNILLKGGHDSAYPFIHLYKEKIGGLFVPMIEITYKKTAKSKYFGPFLNRQNTRTLISLISKTFALPRCKKSNIRIGKGCVNCQIGLCRGFCLGNISQSECDVAYSDIESVLTGGVDEIREAVSLEMEEAAEGLNFEKAAVLRDKLKSLMLITEKQKPMVTQKRNADYISCGESGGKTAVFMLRIRNGYVIGENCNIFDENFSSELLMEFIERFYTEETQFPTKIYIENEHDWMPLVNSWLKGIVTVPTFQSDKDLLFIAKKNADERLLQYEGRTKKGQRLQQLFNNFVEIDGIRDIEIYDISQTAGEEVVCGMVVCSDGIFDKKRYKRFKIDKTDGFDDTAYMHEAVFRRLARFNEGDESFSPLPDLIICDGGRGQVSAVVRAVAENGHKIPVIGFKKDSKHKTKAITPQDPKQPDKPLSKDPEVFAFCGRLQEEAHRFAISYHRNLRDKTTQQSQLREIDGIGKIKAKDLFLKFKSIDKIAAATEEELCEVKGITPTLAKKIKNALSEKS